MSCGGVRCVVLSFLLLRILSFLFFFVPKNDVTKKTLCVGHLEVIEDFSSFFKIINKIL